MSRNTLASPKIPINLSWKRPVKLASSVRRYDMKTRTASSPLSMSGGEPDETIVGTPER